MKIGELTSLGHNIADSLSSGIGLMIGVYDVDIYRAAAASRRGAIEVDFLTGASTCGLFAFKLRKAIRLYAKALPDLCQKHGINPAEIALLKATFSNDSVVGPSFTVTAKSSDGRQSVDRYAGFPGKRVEPAKRRAA